MQIEVKQALKSLDTERKRIEVARIGLVRGLRQKEKTYGLAGPPLGYVSAESFARLSRVRQQIAEQTEKRNSLINQQIVIDENPAPATSSGIFDWARMIAKDIFHAAGLEKTLVAGALGIGTDKPFPNLDFGLPPGVVMTPELQTVSEKLNTLQAPFKTIDGGHPLSQSNDAYLAWRLDQFAENGSLLRSRKSIEAMIVSLRSSRLKNDDLIEFPNLSEAPILQKDTAVAFNRRMEAVRRDLQKAGVLEPELKKTYVQARDPYSVLPSKRTEAEHEFIYRQSEDYKAELAEQRAREWAAQPGNRPAHPQISVLEDAPRPAPSLGMRFSL